MLCRTRTMLGVAILIGLVPANAVSSPHAVRLDGRPEFFRNVSAHPAAKSETGTTCVLSAAANEQYPDAGFVYFFSCEGDEFARRVEFDDCVTGSMCGSWHPRTVTLSFWVSASECAGSYPYTTAPFEAQISIVPADPTNPDFECPRPAQEPVTTGAVFTVPALTRTDPAGSDALAEMALPVYGDCVDEGPLFVVFRVIGIAPEDDACDQAECAGRLPGLLSTGLCSTPACDGPNDPVDTHAPCATYYRNVAQGVQNWNEAADAGIRSDIVLSIELGCCDAIGIEPSTWGRIKALSDR